MQLCAIAHQATHISCWRAQLAKTAKEYYGQVATAMCNCGFVNLIFMSYFCMTMALPGTRHSLLFKARFAILLSCPSASVLRRQLRKLR